MNSSNSDVQKAVGHKYKPYIVEVENKDLMLYALGIGFSKDPLNKDHFKFTYENDENFSSFATMPVVVGHRQPITEFLSTPHIPEFNPMMLLHGEETVEIFKPIPAGSKIKVDESILDIQDKVSGAALSIETHLSNVATGEKHARIITTLFIRGIGGFGYKGTYKSVFPPVPKRQPCAVAEEKTEPNQAILYRLNGDYNPLHIDPEMAQLGNFEKPILHGLCTYGFSARAIYEKFCKGDPNAIKKFSARFTSHVFPGETLIVEMWKDGNIVVFETKTKERGIVVLRGYAELKELAKL